MNKALAANIIGRCNKNCDCVGIYNDAFFLPATQCRFEVGSQYLKSTSIAAPQAAGMIKWLRAHPGTAAGERPRSPPQTATVIKCPRSPPGTVAVERTCKLSASAYCSSGSCYHSGCDNPLPSNFFSPTCPCSNPYFRIGASVQACRIFLQRFI